jgi:hypothetical protein
MARYADQSQAGVKGAVVMRTEGKRAALWRYQLLDTGSGENSLSQLEPGG